MVDGIKETMEINLSPFEDTQPTHIRCDSGIWYRYSITHPKAMKSIFTLIKQLAPMAT